MRDGEQTTAVGRTQTSRVVTATTDISAGPMSK